MIETLLTLLVSFLVVLGAVISLVAAIGLLRLPDIFSRMHAVSKAGTAGSGLALVALAIYSAELSTTIKCIAAVVFLFLTSPVSAHLLAKAQLKIRGNSQERQTRGEE
jgi:multicomponent Na+:H+ antiporter subunit G